jgi:hypothetical protein
MSRLLRMVAEDEWALGRAIERRHSRLLHPPPADALLREASEEAAIASAAKSIRLEWEPSAEAPGFFRVVTQIALGERIFDQFFNGRSGYRAQYYLSPEEGVLYNRDVLQNLRPALILAYSQSPLAVDLELVLRSIDGPHSKVWVYGDQAAFNSAPENSLSPPRWVKNDAHLGCRAPLPEHLLLDVKGAFIHPSSPRLFVDDLKADRACDLYRRGYS